MSLPAATEDIVKHLNASVKPVLIGGVKLRVSEAHEQFLHLVNALGAGVAMMPDAKSLFSESHPLYVSCYETNQLFTIVYYLFYCFSMPFCTVVFLLILLNSFFLSIL
jgi:TPP-dependent 2-oxoacid decarboxylase